MPVTMLVITGTVVESDGDAFAIEDENGKIFWIQQPAISSAARALDVSWGDTVKVSAPSQNLIFDTVTDPTAIEKTAPASPTPTGLGLWDCA